MGVFEFVLAIIFMSFVFKTINLRYESQKNNQSKGGDRSLGIDAMASKNQHGATLKNPVQPGARKSVGASLFLGLLIFAACSFMVLMMLVMVVYLYSPQPLDFQVAIGEVKQPTHLEAPVVITPEAAPVPANSISRTEGKQRSEAPDDFIADVYPSIVDCAAPVAIKIYNEISDRLPAVSTVEAEDSGAEKDEDNQNKIAEKETPEPTKFYIINGGLSDQNYIPFVVAFRKKIQAKIENSTVIDITGRALGNLTQPPKSHYRILVSRLPKEINGQKPYTGGQVVCKVMGKDLSVEVVTPFLQKLWLTDYQAYSQKNPGNHIVGNSDGFSPTAAQALKQALTNCKLDAWTMKSVGQSHGFLDGRRYVQIDKLIQEYVRPYGNVFRCSVLLERDESSQAAMAPVAADLTNSPKLLPAIFDRGWKPSFEWSIALLIGLTVVIGTISNALTQGYYRTEISWSTMSIVLALVLLLIGLAGIGLERFLMH